MTTLRRALTLAVPILTATMLTSGVGLPTAAANPALTATSAADTDAAAGINWRQLGLFDQIEIMGSHQRNDVEVPVPQGVRPTRVTGIIGSVINAIDGRVDVLDGRGVFLGTVPAPNGPATAPFSVDISAAQVVDGKARLSFVLRESNTPTNHCSAVPSVTLTQLATGYSGPSPNPRTVADFLPGYLDRFTIQVGENPTEDQQQAALNLVTKLTALYRPMPVRVDVDTSPDRAVAGESQRVIAIRDGGTAGLQVVDGGTRTAILEISGSGPELLQQVALFTDRRAVFAQSQSATVTSATTDLPVSTNTLTFDQLDMTGETSVLGSTTLYAGFDASDFGAGSIEHAKIRLIANHTPVTQGEASLLIRSGPTVVAARTLDGSGVVDLTAEVPAEAIGSNIGLGLELRYIPSQECAPLSDRITFALDPRSTVTITPGTGNRGGFPVLPMAFTPDFDVATDPAQIGYAAMALNLLGQQSAVPLQPNLVSFEQAAESKAGLLVVADGARLQEMGLNAPVGSGPDTAVDVNGDTTTAVDLNGPLGTVQAFTDDGRTVLAVGSTGDWSLVDRSFDYIRGLENRWASLTGDVVATGAAGETVSLTVREGGPMPYQPAVSDSWKWWTWISVALVAVALVVAAAVVLVRRRAKG